LGPVDRQGALLCFTAAGLSAALGVALAARHYPGGFDWAYTVISRLASNHRNPDGAAWLSGSLLVAVVLAWPTVGYLRRAMRSEGGRPRIPLLGLRMGLLAGAVLALEGLFALDLSPLGRKAHEAVAVVAFLGFYVGVLGLQAYRVRRLGASLLPALLVALPLVAVGLSQVGLYFDQRDLGWVNTEWREMGIPLYLSFAFWQWLAVAGIGIGLGHLVWSAKAPGEAPPHPTPSRHLDRAR